MLSDFEIKKEFMNKRAGYFQDQSCRFKERNNIRKSEFFFQSYSKVVCLERGNLYKTIKKKTRLKTKIIL